MRTTYIAAFAVFTALFAAGVGRTVVTAQAEKTVWSGVFTAEQATRGKEKATAECSACHGAELKGDLAPALTGESFIGHWYDAPLGELSLRITATMPASAPGSLKPEEYADIIAYILQANGFPAGSETLKVQPPEPLDAIKITKTK